MVRTREYYAAIGYTTPYRWAHYADVHRARIARVRGVNGPRKPEIVAFPATINLR